MSKEGDYYPGIDEVVKEIVNTVLMWTDCRHSTSYGEDDAEYTVDKRVYPDVRELVEESNKGATYDFLKWFNDAIEENRGADK